MKNLTKKKEKYERRKCKRCGAREEEGSSMDCWKVSELMKLNPKQEKLIKKQEPLCDSCVKRVLRMGR